MILRELELDEFRSFRKLELAIDPAGIRVVGPNASGKSTLLEAIAMFATTRSPRTSAEREVIHWESGKALVLPPYARLHGRFDRLDGRHQIELRLAFDGQGPLKKQVRLNDRAVRAVDAVGQFKTVLFAPEDVNLLSGAPSGRRRYLDVAISQASRDYLRSLSQYGRVLEQRNSLLRGFMREHIGATAPRVIQELSFWNAELVAAAAEVLAFRMAALSFMTDRAKHHFARLTGDETLTLNYLPFRVQLPPDMPISPDWIQPTMSLRQALAASFSRELEDWRGEELRRGVTAVGPHRDDFTVTAQNTDLGRFGSRGQQRLAIIAIKLGELDLLEKVAGEPPVLLLDDILSELDATHRRQIVSAISDKRAQVCVTTTDEGDSDFESLGHVPLLRVEHGAIARGSLLRS